jgi:two-component system, chemotaxis family, CheB/CheR fusion protein
MAAKQSSSPTDASHITVAGIGASAGGIEALREFFDVLPPDLGLAYVVVVHLAPNHESELASILARRTRMSVVEVDDHKKLELKPNWVYVISPDCKLEIRDGAVGAAPFEEPRGRRSAIDLFFRSLADRYGDGFAVILSGGGSDGAVGAKAVKEAGGVVLVQDPREATHEGMPRAVIAAEIADVVLPVRELAARLAELARSRAKLVTLIRPRNVDPTINEEEEAALKCIFELVRSRTSHDFSRYKRATILRRLARRMQLHHRSGLDHYLAFLRENPEEIQSLFDDLLISVTTFFRDPQAWEALRSQVVIPLIEQCDPNEPIRIWAPGCATGEEAYTLAIVFREEISRRERHCDLVIFGSDVDQSALATAREGVYPTSIVADVSESMLTRYFRVEGDHYRVSAEIRDSVVFAVHSVLRDPPFSKLHLISCRNLLIYLDRELQQQLQNVFRYGLREDGYLFLGISESADTDLFEPADKQYRIFKARHRGEPPVRLPQLPAVPQVPTMVERGRERSFRLRRTAIESHIEALEELAPPSALIDAHWNIEHLSATAGRYLQPRGGPPTQAITDLVRPELLDELRSALHRAFELRQPALSAFVPVRFNGAAQLVAVLVRPRPRSERLEDAQVLVMFLEAGKLDRDEASPRNESGDSFVLSLRDKLRVAEQGLESMRQEHGVAYEDLRAANEELQSLNEEYRSTTEELETSKEELQSVNEELQTVNHELKMKLEEVSRSNNDLENFMAATDIPILFLDRALCIQRYTAPLLQLFNVKAHDHGRPIGDLTHNLQYEGLEQDVMKVLSDLVPIEKSTSTRAGQALLVRIRPYRTAEDRIDGVVVTFVR